MKELIRKLFSPILNYFEAGQGEYSYKESHRKILMVIGVLFLFLSAVCAYLSFKAFELGGILPVLIFFSVGVICEIVGFLGNDRAVAKIWKSK